MGFVCLRVIKVGLQPLRAQKFGHLFALLPCKTIDNPTLTSEVVLDVDNNVFQEPFRFRPDDVEEVYPVEAGSEADEIVLQMQLRHDILRSSRVRSRGEGHDRDIWNFRSKPAKGGILGKKLAKAKVQKDMSTYRIAKVLTPS